LPFIVPARRWTTPVVACITLATSLLALAAPAPTHAGAAVPSARAVALAATPDGGGYWVASSTGGVYPFGDAHSYGSMSGRALNSAIVGLAATPSGNGYWLVASDGGVFNFGDAGFFGSAGVLRLNATIVGMAATPTGKGYWLVASDGGIFSYGDASFRGSTGSLRLNRPVVGMAATPSGQGYWLVASDGGIFSYGGAPFWGSTGGIALNQPIDGMAPASAAGGYWLVAADGGVFTFGAAAFDGSATGDISPLLVDQLASTGGAQQVVVVDSPTAASTTATLTAYENDGNGWYEAFGPIPAVDGRHGWLPGASRVEGDGTTPEGMYALGPTMYGVQPDPGVRFGYHQLTCGDWWDEDPASPTYNTFQHVACGTAPPFGGDSEALWANGTAYPSFAVVDFNTPPIGAFGSAIFLHADTGAPTTGCVSLPLSDLDAVLRWLNPALHPVIVMGPDAVIRSF
jgi:L,D-peptidoglycan transpeptidase YkuD (ErfK/YbiS/YcfS/YnhG family)